MAAESIRQAEALGLSQHVSLDENGDPNQMPADKDVRIKATKVDDSVPRTPFRITREK
jgi:hypothetical protein